MPDEDPSWDAWRRRGLNPRDLPSFLAEFEKEHPTFFAEFEREFARMSNMLNRVMDDAMTHASGPRRGEPFVYGFSMRVGSDGVPHIQPFGSAMENVPSIDATAGTLPEARAPMHDLVEGSREIALTIELPGVEKGDVQLHVAEQAVTVRVEKGKRYAARIALPAKVVPSSAKATFKNGVLDIVLQKTPDADPDHGHKVAID